MWVWVYMLVMHVCQRSMLGVFSQLLCIFMFWDILFHWLESSSIALDYQDNGFENKRVPVLLTTGAIGMCHAPFKKSAVGLNANPHACVTCTHQLNSHPVIGMYTFNWIFRKVHSAFPISSNQWLITTLESGWWSLSSKSRTTATTDDVNTTLLDPWAIMKMSPESG